MQVTLNYTTLLFKFMSLSFIKLFSVARRGLVLSRLRLCRLLVPVYSLVVLPKSMKINLIIKRSLKLVDKSCSHIMLSVGRFL